MLSIASKGDADDTKSKKSSTIKLPPLTDAPPKVEATAAPVDPVVSNPT